MSSKSLNRDERIPVRVGPAETAGPRSHVLLAGDMPQQAALHLPGCTCCAPRGPLARALARLFLARVRGEVAHFDDVVLADGFDQTALDAALTQDVVVAARFRPGG